MKRHSKDFTLIIKGFIVYGKDYPADSVLHIVDTEKGVISDPLAEVVSDALPWRNVPVSVSWHIANQPLPSETLSELTILNLLGDKASGDAAARYQHHHSELTGYLYTDEHFNVGGHDMMRILESHIGKWCHISITIHS